MKGRIIALLGAESTGKTALAQALSQALAQRTGQPCTWVPEWLRLWCQAQGRTPLPKEQAAIAAEQSRRIEQACATHAWVVADTTALMTAVYSQHLFHDAGLREAALAWHRQHHTLNLVTENDLPWQADGHQRDGPQVREPVRDLLLQWLQADGLPWSPVRGSGAARLDSALQPVLERLAP